MALRLPCDDCVNVDPLFVYFIVMSPRIASPTFHTFPAPVHVAVTVICVPLVQDAGAVGSI